jgi:hypothetical protein
MAWIKIIIIVMVTLMFATGASAKTHKVRGVKIKVVNAISKQPIENLKVYYFIEIYSIKHLLGIPLIESTPRNKKMKKRVLYTDKNGEIIIDEYKVRSWRLYSKISGEYFVINLSAKDDDTLYTQLEDNIFIKDGFNEFYNPNKEYKGVILRNCSGKCDIFASKVKQSGNLDFQYENNSFQKDFENITIELTPYQ